MTPEAKMRQQIDQKLEQASWAIRMVDSHGRCLRCLTFDMSGGQKASPFARRLMEGLGRTRGENELRTYTIWRIFDGCRYLPHNPSTTAQVEGFSIWV